MPTTPIEQAHYNLFRKLLEPTRDYTDAIG
jgi:hypothetical protein